MDTLVLMLPLIVGILYTFGIFIGIGLIVLWWRVVKHPARSFEGKRNLWATVLLAIPGVLCIVFGTYYRMTDPLKQSQESKAFAPPRHVPDPIREPSEPSHPVLAYIYIVNQSSKTGKVELGDEVFELEPDTWKRLEFISYDNSDTVRAWLGKRKVIDQVITTGTYIANLSSNAIVVAEEIRYAMWKNVPWEDLKLELVATAGIKMFASELIEDRDIYGFNEDPPLEIELRQGQSEAYLVKYDIDFFSPNEFEKWKASRLEVRQQD